MKSAIACTITTFSFVAFLLIGCAAPTTQIPQVDQAHVDAEEQRQREIALKRRVDMEQRLERVSYPLLHAATPFCTDKQLPHLGFQVWNRDLFPEDYRDAAKRLFDVGDELTVSTVQPESPAYHASIKAGDRILAMNGKRIAVGENAIEAFERQTRMLMRGRVINLTVQRGGGPKEIEFKPDNLCDYEVLLRDKDAVNALADGRRIIVYRGMMRFVASDQELSLVIAHEIAHNAMGHIDAKVSSALFGTFVDIIAATSGVYTLGAIGGLASLTFSPEFEQEADYVGLYIMARAGVEVEDASNFWRNVAIEHPHNIKFSHFSTHPSTPKRFITMEHAIEEIRNKIDNEQPIMPNVK